MLDWWGAVHNSLWIMGLSVCLAALSMVSYRSRLGGNRLRQELSGRGFQLLFILGILLFCLGALFSARTWWESALWGVLVVICVGQIIQLWRSRSREGS